MARMPENKEQVSYWHTRSLMYQTFGPMCSTLAKVWRSDEAEARLIAELMISVHTIIIREGSRWLQGNSESVYEEVMAELEKTLTRSARVKQKEADLDFLENWEQRRRGDNAAT